MPTTSYIAQSFRKEGRRLVADIPHKATTPDSAISIAQRLAERKSGAVALRLIGDEETGEMDEPLVLYSRGQVPPELQDAAG